MKKENLQENEQLLISDIEKLYPREWLLVGVTKQDDRGEAEKGIVIAHSDKRDEISEALENLSQEESRRLKPFYIFKSPVGRTKMDNALALRVIFDGRRKR